MSRHSGPATATGKAFEDNAVRNTKQAGDSIAAENSRLSNDYLRRTGGKAPGAGGGGEGANKRKKETRQGVKGEMGPDGVWRPNTPGEQPREKSEGWGGKNAGGGGQQLKGPPGDDDPNSDTNVSNMIRDTALKVASGEESSFSPKRVSDMKDQLFSATIGRVKHDVRALDASAAKRGMFRSGISQRSEGDLRRNALNAYSSGVKDIMIKKVEAEFKDKMQGMQLAQGWLTQKQNYELGKERNQIAREQIAATMASAQLSAQTARMGIAASSANARAALDYRQKSDAIQYGFAVQDRVQNYTPEGANKATASAGLQ